MVEGQRALQRQFGGLHRLTRFRFRKFLQHQSSNQGRSRHESILEERPHRIRRGHGDHLRRGCVQLLACVTAGS